MHDESLRSDLPRWDHKPWREGAIGLLSVNHRMEHQCQSVTFHMTQAQQTAGDKQGELKEDVEKVLTSASNSCNLASS